MLDIWLDGTVKVFITTVGESKFCPLILIIAGKLGSILFAEVAPDVTETLVITGDWVKNVYQPCSV